MAELILLTGGTGMLGFQILVEALQLGYRVRAAVRSQEKFEKIQSHRLVAPYKTQLESVIVPDITVEGAYDEAVKGVDAVVHVASPIVHASITDYVHELIRPAVRGTVGMLESAAKAPSIRRVVITASIGSIIPGDKLMSGDTKIYNETSVCPAPPNSFNNALEGYLGSKVIAFQATTEFMANHKPAFDLINIFPGYFIGRNDLATDVKDLFLGTNRTVLNQLLGQPAPFGLTSTSAFINDVAKVHVLALNSAISGNQNFIVSSDGPEGLTWGDAIDIVSKHYSEDVIKAAGFKLDGERTATHRVLIDSSHSQKVLGFKPQPYQTQVISIVDQYLELLGLKEGSAADKE